MTTAAYIITAAAAATATAMALWSLARERGMDRPVCHWVIISIIRPMCIIIIIIITISVIITFTFIIIIIRPFGVIIAGSSSA
jgi:hypothetical protein